ncbi:MAG: hypothetical protein DWP98_13785 [Bacteroidetes bacterium]|nr:MAG: hypothetical protein DWP98_13785 [Bacteroidota bacterium]MBL1144609.1 hypothetical protein [Bacteroidota bacterium]NOG57404.1 hypothetical protein [Bacteroidota bacterium]
MNQNKYKTILLFSFLVLFYSCADSQTNQTESKTKKTSISLPLDDSHFVPLLDTKDEELQAGLQQIINKNPKWAELVKNKKMAFGVVDLYDVDHIKYAAINGDFMMYAASLPKIAVLLAAMDAIEKKEIEDTKALRADLRIMISKSNNAATTRVIDLLGFEKIASVMQDTAYRFYDKDNGGGLWVGKRYAASGKRVPEPLKGISHAATVDQVCRFYYDLAFGRLVNRERSTQMLKYMEKPEIHHKFVNTLEKIAPKAKLYRKSGSWTTFHADSILVWEDGKRRYILVALIDDKNGEQIIRQLVNPIEKVLKIAKHTTTQ